MRKRLLTSLLLLSLAMPPGAVAHDGSLAIRSTLFEAGSLSLGTTAIGPLVVVEAACAAGQCLYTNGELAISAPSTDLDPPGLFALKIATVVRLEIVSVDAGASLKVGNTVLDAAGESVQLGASWSLHADPVLQASGTQGQARSWTIAVKLTSSRYASSDPITIDFQNFAVTTTSSTTSTTLALCGDEVVGGDEACDGGAEPWAAGRACRDDCTLVGCGDVDDNDAVTSGDALFVLRAAVGSRSCDACLCNVDASASGPAVSVSDALRVLRNAVGAVGANLTCPACP